MPFVDANDNVFLYETLPCTRILPGHGAPGGKDLFAQMREYLTAAQKEYLGE